MEKIAVLIVDTEEWYTDPDDVLDCIIDGELDPVDVAEEIKEKFDEILYNVSNSNYDIFITHRRELYEGFEDLGETLPAWEVNYDTEEIHPRIVKKMKEYDEVIVCGIFKERCVKEVNRRLIMNGVNSNIDESNVVSSSVIGEYLD